LKTAASTPSWASCSGGGAGHWTRSADAGSPARGLPLRRWDFAFYLILGTVVTSSVQIAGVLLVFTLLVVPTVMGADARPMDARGAVSASSSVGRGSSNR
jgi:hypothetical protein